MISYNNVHNGPVMSAAKKALETGKAHHILIWISGSIGKHAEKSVGKSML